MHFFGKILGLIIGLSSGTGLLGFLFGTLIGHIVDSFYSNRKEKNYQEIFFRIMFQVMGHLSKSKGCVTNQDIQIALHIMDRMQLYGSARTEAKTAFQEGKKYNYPLRYRLKELKTICIGRFDLIRTFLEIQIQTALSDGIIQSKERQVLLIIAEELGISYNQFQYFLKIIQDTQSFSQNYEKNSWNNSYSKNFTQEKKKTALEEAYNILGVNKNDNFVTIKRAYRKLMSKHHPDKLSSKNLTKDMLELAKQKAQKIQLAYDFLKKEKKLKY